MSSEDNVRWANVTDAPTVPQWQPPPSTRTHLNVAEQQKYQQQQQQPPLRHLPRTQSGPSQIGGWYTSSDMALRWLRPARLARASSADISRGFEPQLVSPIRKPGRPQFPSSVRQQRPAPAASTIRVVSSDWTPAGFERTVGVFAGRPQWSPLVRRTLQEIASRERAAMTLAAPGTLRTLSHPPANGGTGDADKASPHPSPAGPRSSWPPVAHTPFYAGGWAAFRDSPVLEQPRSLPRAHAESQSVMTPVQLPPVPMPAPNRRRLSKVAPTNTVPPHGWCVLVCPHVFLSARMCLSS